MFSTFSAKYANTFEDAALEAIPALCSIDSKSNSGSFPDKKKSNLLDKVSLSFLQASITAFFSAAFAVLSLITSL